MPETPFVPTPDAIAHWLFTSEGGASVDRAQLLIRAIQNYETLRGRLAIFLGPQGFDALWARALHLTQRTLVWKLSDTEAAVPSSMHQLDMLARGRDVAETHTVFLVIFTQFLTLLFTFIGADLGFRLIQQSWPTLSAATAHHPSQDKEARHE